jgi:hypothetical protein
MKCMHERPEEDTFCEQKVSPSDSPFKKTLIYLVPVRYNLNLLRGISYEIKPS